MPERASHGTAAGRTYGPFGLEEIMDTCKDCVDPKDWAPTSRFVTVVSAAASLGFVYVAVVANPAMLILAFAFLLLTILSLRGWAFLVFFTQDGTLHVHRPSSLQSIYVDQWGREYASSQDQAPDHLRLRAVPWVGAGVATVGPVLLVYAGEAFRSPRIIWPSGVCSGTARSWRLHRRWNGLERITLVDREDGRLAFSVKDCPWVQGLLECIASCGTVDVLIAHLLLSRDRFETMRLSLAGLAKRIEASKETLGRSKHAQMIRLELELLLHPPV